MRPGVAGVLPADPRAIDRSSADALAALGFTGVSVTLPEPEACSESDLVRAREVLARAGLAVAQANPRYHSLVGADEVRRRGIAALRAACRCARWLGAKNVYARPGSLNPRGSWLPHPRNLSPGTIEQLIASLREATVAAEAEGVAIAVEGHVVSPLDTPERVRLVLDAVGSPALKFNADPVNFVGTLADAYDSSSLIDRLFSRVGGDVICAHLKDVRVEERLVLHIAECAPGEGLLDLPEFLRRFEESCPDGFVLIEHLSLDAVPAAKRVVDLALARAGLDWR